MKTTLPVRASRWAVAAILLALCGSPALAEDAAAPGAAPNAQGRRWMLDFSHGPLKRIQIDDGTGQLTTYLYMTLEVANHTGLARNWVPFVTGKVDTRATPYVAGGFPLALDAIRRKEGNKTLEAIDTSAWRKGDEGKLEDGASKKVVAIFGTVDPGWATFRVEVNGLMNPITTLKVRKYGDKQIVLEAAYAGRNAKVEAELKAAAKASQSEIPQPTAEYQEVQERRVRAIEYQRDGDEFRPDDDVIQFVREDWEVIGDPKVIRTIPSAS